MSLRAIKIRGPYRGPMGYDNHVRHFVTELHRLGVAIQLEEVAGTGPPLAGESMDWFDSFQEPVDAQHMLHFQMPHQVDPDVGKVNVNYTMFECDRIPEEWARAASGQDRIVVPTESSRAAWLAAGIAPERLRICPLGVDVKTFQEDRAPLVLSPAGGKPIPEFRYRFLNVAELRPRKNHLGLLRAWIRATDKTDDAVLILKIGIYQPELVLLFQRDLAHLEREVGKSFEEAAPLCLLFDVLGPEEVPALFAAATHYVSLSFGEGWDQCMMQAGVRGLQLVAPDHTAYRHYLIEENAFLIPAVSAPAVGPGDLGGVDGAVFEGLRWWRPEEDHAVDVFRSIIRDNVRKASGRERLAAEFPWEAAARRLVKCIQELPPRGET